jgi:hypothetical protein
MKKVILSAITVGLLFASTNLFAQITVGPKLGYNLSSIRYKAIASGSELDATDDIKNNSGFNIGAMLNAQLGDYFSIRPELLYNQAGYKYKGTSAFSTTETTANYSYLSIPVNFVGMFPIGDNFKLQGILGISTSFGLSGKEVTDKSYTNGNPSTTTESTIKMKKDPDVVGDKNTYFNGLDMGINYGIGCQYKAFVFSAVYNLGLSNINPHYSNQAIEDTRGDWSKSYNKSMSFSVAYLFGGK